MKPWLLTSVKYRHTCDELFALAGILPLRDQVHANRLRFMSRLLTYCPQVTWMLLNGEGKANSWATLCLDSCRWFRKHYDRPVGVGTEASLLDWIQHIRLDPRWKGKIRKAMSLALAYQRAHAEHNIWQRHFETRLGSAGMLLPAEDPQPKATEQWQCDLCQKIFCSTRALAMHASREHGYRKKVRYFASGDTCPVCCRIFHTRKRLSVHLEKQTKCYLAIQACWPPMPKAQVDELDETDRQAESHLRQQGWWASKALQPALQAMGPALPPQNHPASALMYSRMQARRPEDDNAYEQLQGHRIDHLPAPTSGIWWHNADIPAYVLHSAQGPDQGAGAFAMGQLARETALLHVTARVVVHFFSGYRRQGDLHEIIEHKVIDSGQHIFVISVDLCMQRQSADLATHSAVKWWRDRVFAGQIVSAGGGPPCETYTAARHHAGGPRPLRSPDECRGIPGLTRREWAQITIGDRLLRFLLDILAALAIMGMSGFLEHPQYPVWLPPGQAVSIWELWVIRLLRRLQCFSVVSFDQCVCGAEGKKPTTLLLLRLPRVRERLLCSGEWGRCSHGPKAHGALIGRQQDGTFNTAKAKVYPPGLNRILGEEMYRFAVTLTAPATSAEIPAVFAEFQQHQIFDANTVQPDYHGGTV